MRQSNVMRFAFSTIIVAIALALLAGCRFTRTNADVPANSSKGQQLRVETPQASWELIFFRYIDELAKVGNLPSLRSMELPNEDLEARFWFEAGYFGMDGIVIRRTSGIWSGIYLHGISREPNFQKYAEQMQPPRSGWDTAWQRLVDAGLLTMPDAQQVQCNVNGLDGAVFVFETNVDKTYRNYLYDDPMFAECDEARKILNLVSIINHEFGFQWPTTK